jgi:Ni,Fe-hydrogenase III large subunit
MMDAVVPGGVARDFAPSCAATVAALLEDVRRLFPQLVELDDNTAWLQDRTATTGILRSELARQFGAGGYVGRASGRASIRARCSPIRKILSTLCRRKCSLKRTETPTQSVRAFHSKT